MPICAIAIRSWMPAGRRTWYIMSRALPAWAGDGRIFIESTRLARGGLSRAAAGMEWADWFIPAAPA